jgi:hypothetical protein
MTQNFANHRHTPTLFIVSAVFTLAAIVFYGMHAVHYTNRLWSTTACVIGAVACACAMGRRYITALQDRIIKMELRYRTDKFLTPAQQQTLWDLAKPQMIAIRFASDAEMPALIDRAAKEHLSATDIKKAVKDWQGDFDRT